MHADDFAHMTAQELDTLLLENDAYYLSQAVRAFLTTDENGVAWFIVLDNNGQEYWDRWSV